MLRPTEFPHMIRPVDAAARAGKGQLRPLDTRPINGRSAPIRGPSLDGADGCRRVRTSLRAIPGHASGSLGVARKRSFAPDFRTCQSPAHANSSSAPRLLQIGGVEAFGEPAIDRREEIASFSAAIAAEPGEARGGAQFPELSLLLET